MRRFIPQSVRRLKNKLLNHGRLFHCPLCNSNLKRLLPLPAHFDVRVQVHGDEYGVRDYETLSVDDHICPVCGSFDRDRLIWLYLDRLKSDGNGENLLHFAPEKSLLTYLRDRKRYNVRTADLLRSDVDDRVDITDMACYRTGFFDAFICSHVLEHVVDDARAMAELRRILKPGGWGITMVPLLRGVDRTYEDFSKTTEEERLRHFGQADHVRLYGRADFIDRLGAAGFSLERYGIDEFGVEAFARFGLTPTSTLYVVR